MSALDYRGFPFADINDFETVVFDCTVTDEGYHYLTLNFFKQFADEGEQNAEGLIFSTNIGALTLQEIDARCGVLFRAGLFAGLDIDSHGTLYDTHGNTLGPICWNHVHAGGSCEFETVTPVVTTLTPTIQ